VPEQEVRLPEKLLFRAPGEPEPARPNHQDGLLEAYGGPFDEVSKRLKREARLPSVDHPVERVRFQSANQVKTQKDLA
jgi:hypothetical protein